jgi:hypothetical protein
VGKIVGDYTGADEETGGKRRSPSKLADGAISRKSLKAQGQGFGEHLFRNQQVTRSSPTSANQNGTDRERAIWKRCLQVLDTPKYHAKSISRMLPSVDSSKPATDRHFKTGHGRGGRDQ